MSIVAGWRPVPGSSLSMPVEKKSFKKPNPCPVCGNKNTKLTGAHLQNTYCAKCDITFKPYVNAEERAWIDL